MNEMTSTVTKVIILMVVLSLLSTLIIGLAIRKEAKNQTADLGLITLVIDGEMANLTADLDLSADVDPDGTDLEIDIGEKGNEVDFDGKEIETSLSEEDFREMMERDSINISGDIKAKLIGPIDMTVGIREEVNISFIHQLSETLNVSNVQINFSFFSNPKISFDLDANISRDFQLNITNTEATLATPAGEMKARIEEMNFRTGEGGKARISIPPLNLLGLALFNREVVVEVWGIEVEVDIPLFSG
jgi:hypothetical protein